MYIYKLYIDLLNIYKNNLLKKNEEILFIKNTLLIKI
jgi:hypothetical protein